MTAKYFSEAFEIVMNLLVVVNCAECRIILMRNCEIFPTFILYSTALQLFFYSCIYIYIYIYCIYIYIYIYMYVYMLSWKQCCPRLSPQWLYNRAPCAQVHESFSFSFIEFIFVMVKDTYLLASLLTYQWTKECSTS